MIQASRDVMLCLWESHSHVLNDNVAFICKV